jgi:hypothetical protein
MQRETFRPRQEEVKCEWEHLYREEIHNLQSLPNVMKEAEIKEDTRNL